MAHEVFKHGDGRSCDRRSPTAPWLYESEEDKDRQLCDRYHNDPADGKLLGHSLEFEGVNPRSGPLKEPGRGEFGMPGLGVGKMMLTVDENDQGSRCGNIFDEAQTLFRRKNRGYGNTAYNLGARGQYADINRKMGKLKHQLWDGKVNEDDEGESMEEMLMDLMGHCALTIDFLRSGDL